MLRRRVPWAWPAVWTHGGVEGVVKLTYEYLLIFSVSGDIDYDGPASPTGKKKKVRQQRE